MELHFSQLWMNCLRLNEGLKLLTMKVLCGPGTVTTPGMEMIRGFGHS